jgi:dolichyl-diphosphooligosaccharide--protein glycosyltransferase
MGHPGAASRALRRLAPLALFVSALALRAVGWRDVFVAGMVLPLEHDAWYHLRRIAYGIAAFPRALEFDPYLNFPEGAKPIWTPVFDGFAAALLWPFADPLAPGGLDRLERLAMWLPPLLGATTVVVVYAIARRHFGAGAGWVAGISLCLLSGHVWYTQLGFLDHHAAVGLAASALLGALLGWIEREQAGRAAAAWRLALLYGAALAATLAVWPGGLLHVALCELAAIAFALSRSDAAQARALATRQAAAHALATLAIAPLALGNEWPQWGRLSPVVLSDFQPWLFASATIVWGVCAASWRGVAVSPAARRARFALACLGVAGASLLLLPALREAGGDAWRWLGKREAFQAQVAESQPLFVEDGRFTATIAATRLSLVGLVFPLAAGAIAFAARRRPERARIFSVLAFATGLYAATLLQRRFFDTASIGVALSLGLGARELRQWLERRLGTSRRAGFAVALGLGVALLPSLRGTLRPLANEWNALRADRVWVTGSFGLSRAGVELALALRGQSPEASGWLDPSRTPPWGVLAPWHLGHVIEYVGRRATVVSNFGDDLGADSFAFMERYYLAREPEIEFELDRRRIRFVVAQRFPTYLAHEPGRASLFRALYARDGSAIWDARAGALIAPALGRHRLVYETLGRDFRDLAAAPVYKLFEVVAGAQVEGRAAPGRWIEASLALRTNRGREVAVRTRTVAEADGRYRLRLAHATRGGPPTLSVAPAWQLACGGERRALVVDEQAVQQGMRLDGPDLCLPEPGPAADARRKP